HLPIFAPRRCLLDMWKTLKGLVCGDFFENLLSAIPPQGTIRQLLLLLVSLLLGFLLMSLSESSHVSRTSPQGEKGRVFRVSRLRLRKNREPMFPTEWMGRNHVVGR